MRGILILICYVDALISFIFDGFAYPKIQLKMPSKAAKIILDKPLNASTPHQLTAKRFYTRSSFAIDPNGVAWYDFRPRVPRLVRKPVYEFCVKKLDGAVVNFGWVFSIVVLPDRKLSHGREVYEQPTYRLKEKAPQSSEGTAWWRNWSMQRFLYQGRRTLVFCENVGFHLNISLRPDMEAIREVAYREACAFVRQREGNIALPAIRIS